jgi:ferredoxin-NADP reductase
LTDQRLSLRVSNVAAEAKDALVVELRDPGGAALPPFTPGAHIELHLSNGLIRHYSLCNDWRERDRYVVGIGLAVGSRGGSLHIHRTLRPGDIVDVTAPRNNFPLAEAAPRHDFLAGGIGITPILSMVRWCAANRRDWHLWYLVRNRQRAAFLEELGEFAGNVTLHADDEAGALFDVTGTVARLQADSHIYCCGPAPLMTAVEAAAQARPPEQMHFEWFTPKQPMAADSSESFTVVLARSGRRLLVPAGKSILEVLGANHLNISFSCREGLCATCETPVLAGKPDHRDSVLTETEKAANNTMMICVSRALSDELTLDL